MDKESADTPGMPAPAARPLPKPKPAPPVAPAGTAARERATPEGDGLDPTRYGDWEKNGRCIDF